MNKFDRSAKREYTVITPLSPLEDLETFLKNNLFALGTPVLCISCCFKLLMYPPPSVQSLIPKESLSSLWQLNKTSMLVPLFAPVTIDFDY